jgi:hypothetical protein
MGPSKAAGPISRTAKLTAISRSRTIGERPTHSAYCGKLMFTLVTIVFVHLQVLPFEQRPKFED